MAVSASNPSTQDLIRSIMRERECSYEDAIKFLLNFVDSQAK